MLIVKVVKPLVSTNRIPDFEHKHLQVVLDGSTKKVAVDAVGAKPGDWVICVSSSAAREAAGSKSYPSDLTIVGIIDHWEPDPPKTLRPSSRQPPRSQLRHPAARLPEVAGQLMEIMQVMGTLVCTFRVAGLDHMHLRVLQATPRARSSWPWTPWAPVRATGCSPPAAQPPGMRALTTRCSPI